MKKKVLIIFPGLVIQNDDGAKHRLLNFASFYKQNNFQVSILIFFSLKSLKVLNKRKKYLSDNYHWLVFPSFGYMKLRIVSIFNIIYQQIIIYILTRLFSYDIIHAELALSGIILKYIKKKKLIVDFHGESVAEFKFSQGNINWKIALLERSIKHSLNNADRIICVTNNLAKCYNIEKPIIAPSCVDVDRFTPYIEKKNELRQKTGINNSKLIIGYVGGLQKWQCIDEMLELFKKLKTKLDNLFLYILTNDDYTDFINKLNNFGYKENIDFKISSSSREDVPKIVPIFDLGLLLREKHLLNSVASPTKAGEYLASGVPILTTKYAGDVPELLVNSNCGIVLSNNTFELNEVDKIILYINYYMHHKKDIIHECINIAATKHNWEYIKKNNLQDLII